MKHVFYGYMKGGKLQCQQFIEWLKATGDRPVTIVASDTKPTRSNQQNRYYWGVVVELIYKALRDLGWEINREGTHELLRVRFLSEDKLIGTDGEWITRVKSTTELSTAEFMDYTEDCKRFAAEYLNVNIPDPNEQMELTEAAA